MPPLVLGTSTQAATVSITNHSFEAAVLAPGASVAGVVGWVTSGLGPGTGSLGAGEFTDPMPDKINYAWTNNSDDVISQDVGAVVANTTYTLTVATGWRTDLPGSGFPT